MGILSRFRDVMMANVGGLLGQSEDPEKTIEECLRQMNRDLGQVKAETASVLAEESRAKRKLEECAEEARKLQRYAAKAVESGDETGALKFLERKAGMAGQLRELQSAYDQAADHAAKMKQMQDKLAADVSKLEARRTELRVKLAEAEALRRKNGSGGAGEAFRELEAKAGQALNEAEALAELRAGMREDDLDELIAQLERGKEAPVPGGPESNAEAGGTAAEMSPEDELAAIKAKLNK
ncbi:PspA/IM30 family protein [Paenibacillus sp. alder61]|uniref:PspA/IM30 family protein n=1 Tax=Paenibacillus sp. alder61 TaxID=2862948 RepID=UPI001CD6A228|nr:PspA/IM30 family protein [Paenibacillus sp. alder61]MCA1292148.1 PspA/IM30 family protein [Paenibacillus sp. alder61]